MTEPVTLRDALDAVVRERAVPGIVCAVQRSGAPTELLAVGTDAAGVPLAPDALLPVASVSKLAVALAILRLAADGALAIDDPLAAHLPGAAAAQDGVTLRALLSHTAGLPVDVAPALAPYAPGLDWLWLGRACLATPLESAPGERVRYGNVGTGLLALVVEARTGRPFPAALAELVLVPLGIEAYLGAEPPRPPARLTGDLGENAGTPLEPYNSPFWRSLAIPWGGLVTTASGALALVRAFAPGRMGVAPTAASLSAAPTTPPPSPTPSHMSLPPFLPEPLRAEATRDQAAGLEGGLFPPLWWPVCPWGLGVEIRGAKKPHWTPPTASAGSFGHAGASGALAWVDPAADVAWAILGTRTFERWWTRWPGIGAVVLGTAPSTSPAAVDGPRDAA